MQVNKTKLTHYIFACIFPLVLYVKFKRLGRGIVIHLISFMVTYFAVLDLMYIFSVPYDYVIENLLIVNIVLWGMWGLMIRDSLQITKVKQ